MASGENSILARYNSKFWEEQAEAWGCCTQDWWGENSWVHPELARMLDVILHAKACGARLTLVVPVWEGEKWWPLLVGGGGEFRSEVVDWRVLPRGEEHFTPVPNSTLFGHGPLRFDVIALRLHYGWASREGAATKRLPTAPTYRRWQTSRWMHCQDIGRFPLGRIMHQVGKDLRNGVRKKMWV